MSAVSGAASRHLTLIFGRSAAKLPGYFFFFHRSINGISSTPRFCQQKNEKKSIFTFSFYELPSSLTWMSNFSSDRASRPREFSYGQMVVDNNVLFQFVCGFQYSSIPFANIEDEQKMQFYFSVYLNNRAYSKRQARLQMQSIYGHIPRSFSEVFFKQSNPDENFVEVPRDYL